MSTIRPRDYSISAAHWDKYGYVEFPDIKCPKCKTVFFTEERESDVDDYLEVTCPKCGIVVYPSDVQTTTFVVWTEKSSEELE